VGRPLSLAIAFLAGGGVGAVAYATFERPKPAEIVYVDRPVIAPPVTADVDAGASLEAMPSDASAPAAANAGARGAAIGSGRAASASLAAQQILLDEARGALGRGENDAAWRAIATHERRYPDSLLGEEREGLAIKVLVASGRYAEAQQRGARFAERHPHSLLLPAIRDSLQTIP
jgi:hypothetical protein